MDKWLGDLDGFMKQFWGIDHVDAGMDERTLARYRDLPPKEAALAFGEDYDLACVDAGWC